MQCSSRKVTWSCCTVVCWVCVMTTLPPPPPHCSDRLQYVPFVCVHISQCIIAPSLTLSTKPPLVSPLCAAPCVAVVLAIGHATTTLGTLPRTHVAATQLPWPSQSDSPSVTLCTSPTTMRWVWSRALCSGLGVAVDTVGETRAKLAGNCMLAFAC